MRKFNFKHVTKLDGVQITMQADYVADVPESDDQEVGQIIQQVTCMESESALIALGRELQAHKERKRWAAEDLTARQHLGEQNLQHIEKFIDMFCDESWRVSSSSNYGEAEEWIGKFLDNLFRDGILKVPIRVVCRERNKNRIVVKFRLSQ